MGKGRIIFLNGLTSSGKSTAAELMRSLAVPIVYVVSNDLFHGMTARKFWQKDYWGMVAHTIGTQYYAARAMADSGCTVVIDGMLLDLEGYVRHFGKRNPDLMRAVFDGCDLTAVDLICPAEELRRRNLLRGDRGEFQSDEQRRMMAKDFAPDLTFDAMTVMPDEAAARILDFCGIPREPVPAETVIALRLKLFEGLFAGLDCRAEAVSQSGAQPEGQPVGFRLSGKPERLAQAASLLLLRGWSGNGSVLTRPGGEFVRLTVTDGSDGADSDAAE